MERLEVYASIRLSRTVYRAVRQLPPTAEDFRAYTATGRDIPSADYLRLSAVSMYRARAELERARTKYRLPPETAELDLRLDPRIRYALTNPRTGHLAVWAPPEALLACVI
jgi:hypothetical protein